MSGDRYYNDPDDIDNIRFQPDEIDLVDDTMYTEQSASEYLTTSNPEVRDGNRRIKGTRTTQQLFPRVGWWTKNPELGQKKLFAPDENNNQIIVKMAPAGMPRSWCVSLGMEYSQLADDINFQVVCEILVGAGGSAQTYEVDWNNGAKFSVCGDTIQISARYDGTLPESGEGDELTLIVPTDLTLSAQLGEYTGMGFPQPTRTVALYELGTENTTKLEIEPGAQSQFVRIPPFATTVQMIPLNSLTHDLLFDVPGVIDLIQVRRGATGNPIGFYNNDTWVLFSAGSGYPLASGARFIYIENNSLTDEFSGFLQFGIQT